MTTSIEDRLGTHFAEQAARDDLGEPDPQTVVTRALAAPRPTEQGRGGRGRPGRPRRIAVVGGLVAACLLAVVAVIATAGRGGDSVDMAHDPTTDTEPRTTTTVPGTTTGSVAESTTTTPAGAAAAPAGSVVVAAGGILGRWDGAAWVDDVDSLPAPVQGGERYLATRVGTPGIVSETGPAPVRLGCVADDFYAVELPAFDPPTRAGVAVTGVRDIQPRPVTVVDPAGYRDAAVAALASLGVDDPRAVARQVVRADLDGDGDDEILMTVDRVADRENLRAAPGDYSMVFLRRVVDGGVETVPVEQVVADVTPGEFPFIVVHDVTAVADLNGDGRMEAVVDSNYYEGGSTTAYELGPDGALRPVLGIGCGV